MIGMQRLAHAARAFYERAPFLVIFLPRLRLRVHSGKLRVDAVYRLDQVDKGGEELMRKPCVPREEEE